MGTTGIVRKLDDLGRVVIPKELRRSLLLAEGDGLEISIDGDRIYLRKHVENCTVCCSNRIVAQLETVALCADCLHRMAEQEKSRPLESGHKK